MSIKKLAYILLACFVNRAYVQMDSTTVMVINLENYRFPSPVHNIQHRQFQMDYTGHLSQVESFDKFINALAAFLKTP